MSYASRWLRTAIALAVMGVLGSLGSCSDNPGGPVDPAPPGSLIVSNAVLTVGLAQAATSGVAPSSAAAEAVAYVSLPPGTAPTGHTAIIRRVGDAGSIITAVFTGGFDPVPVNAATGDSIDVIVRNAARETVLQTRLAVAPRRPPVVVRTNPPRKKTDVRLNSAIVLVFSEPVASNSLTPSSVRLFRGSSAVAGTVRLLEGTGTVAVFVPSAPLAANTQHRLEVTTSVQDLEGDALEAGVTVQFTTGQSSTGPAASITVTPDSVFMSGATYQMTATVRDAAGSELIDQPIIWSTTDPQGLAVSTTGLLTARALGYYDVAATVNGLGASARVIVVTGPPASVEVTPASATVGAAGDTIKLTATVRDALGRLIGVCTPPAPICVRVSVTWTSSAPLLATVAPDSSAITGQAFATVTGVSPGSVTITATSEAASATASITVTQPLPVATVTVTPATATVLPQKTVQLSATLRDANDKILAGRTIAWATDNAAAATVDASGLVTGVSPGPAAVTATSEGASDTAEIAVIVLSFASVTTGGYHTCGLTTSGAAWCWGHNGAGQLGVGNQTGPEFCSGIGTDQVACSRAPTAVSTGVTFDTLDAGDLYACGLTSAGEAYCWGANHAGQLGDGTGAAVRTSPVAVLGGLSFAAVTAGGLHTCGVTTGGAAYCWGGTPLAVPGGLTFAAVSAGVDHTCGITTGGAAHCWGSTPPAAVPGGLTFATVSAGYYHNCGVTTGGAAYCWGSNNYGQLGDGTKTSYPATPVAVLGGLTFAAVSGGGAHTCGVTSGGAAYCWGSNTYGQLGDGTTTDRPTPVAVQSGLTFAAVSAGGAHTCGVTTGGAVYCWGTGEQGQLGTGATTNSSVPVKVAGQP